MIAGRLRPRRTGKVAAGHEGPPEEQQPRRTRRYLAFILGAGAVSGVAALAGIPPFGNFQAVLGPINQLLHPPAPVEPIKASAIFQPVPPVHKTVDVYDPAPPAAAPPPAAQPPATPPSPSPTPTPRHHGASPTPTPLHSSPSPSPHGGG